MLRAPRKVLGCRAASTASPAMFKRQTCVATTGLSMIIIFKVTPNTPCLLVAQRLQTCLRTSIKMVLLFASEQMMPGTPLFETLNTIKKANRFQAK
jgi:hypothetical protein